ncbi:sporulation membrane protein YtaF [Paenibacillus thermoaerophilus]|uniref:Sporulation membrane protein YtaF n=1 Tax=Paenibacillus thermoaerophilus TaxID=1215385 RepID=A0ABW2V1G6_9BACL|nr:sporulation membrane protein YtaF [Paenibacillus thermoaerophilus]TMV15977.1 sporulation membrane protein YtaF [Paenibacillus thermoaerophilus]
MWPTVLLLALAVSLDGFGAGVTYGLRKIRVPWLSVAIIAVCSGAVIALSMAVGRQLEAAIDPRWAKVLGAWILIGIGCWALVQFLLRGNKETAEAASLRPEDADIQETCVFHWEWKSVGLVIRILRTPSLADMDRSGTITSGEALWLGLALSLDALGAGIGAALLGLPVLATSAGIALVSGVFIAAGLQMGYWLSHVRWIRKLALLPAFLLIVLGVSKLFG